MVWIETQAQASVDVRAELEQTFNLVCDIPIVGAFTPGVIKIDKVGEREFRWQMSTRRGVGTSFTPDYVCKYSDNGKNEMTFETVSGNIKTHGRWTISGSSTSARVTVSVTTELDAPVPRLMKKPAQIFANREAKASLEKQLQGLKRRLER